MKVFLKFAIIIDQIIPILKSKFCVDWRQTQNLSYSKQIFKINKNQKSKQIKQNKQTNQKSNKQSINQSNKQIFNILIYFT